MFSSMENSFPMFNSMVISTDNKKKFLVRVLNDLITLSRDREQKLDN